MTEHGRDIKGATAIPQVNEHSDQLAVDRPLAPSLTAGPLDDLMRELHQISGPIGNAVNGFVPFPESLPFTPDATVSDITISSTATHRAAVTIAYRTDHELETVAALYTQTFADVGVAIDDLVAPAARLAVVREQGHTGNEVTPSGTEAEASCRVSIADHDSSRLVRLAVDYGEFDSGPLFEKYADWHQGAAPVDDAIIDRFEIKTLTNEPRPTFSTLYTTRYRLRSTTLGHVRPQVEHRLREAGWTWLEPAINVLYLDGPFDAETHLTQDGADTLVDFVGEFGPFPAA